MKIKLLDGIAEVGVDITYFVCFTNTESILYEQVVSRIVEYCDKTVIQKGTSHFTPSFLHKSSLLFYLKQNDLPYNEEDFIGIEAIDYSNNLIKEELKEISTELLRQELANRGYAVETLWSIYDVNDDMTDEEKLAKMNAVLCRSEVTEYINDCLND